MIMRSPLSRTVDIEFNVVSAMCSKFGIDPHARIDGCNVLGAAQLQTPMPLMLFG